MANETQVRITAIVDGDENVKALSSSIRALGTTAQPAATSIDQLRKLAIELGTATGASTRAQQVAIKVLRELQSVVSAGGNDFKRFANDIKNVKGFDVMSAGAMQAKARLQELRRSIKEVGSDFVNFSRNPTAITESLAGQAAVQGSIERNRRKRGLLGADISATPLGPEAPSQLFRSIAAISDQSASNASQRMGGSYAQIAQRIREVSAESDNSIRSLQAQRSAWENLRSTIGPLDTEYKQIKLEADRAIKATDQELQRRLPGAGRDRLMRFGQTAGAVAAAGVFGGPEGLVGAGIGALGGPGGALAGGAIGAQFGMIRQQIGGFATYASEIQKLQIALKGITTVQNNAALSQQNYQQGLRAVEEVTKRFNIPQQEATKGFTQLAASVIGAGGKVADAEVVFRNVNAAIKAQGGNAQDAQAAMTALSQIFSKGKVSAEELQGQLGERLSGAVTRFAESTGRTLPQLQKDLQAGTVGLADLMKFITSDKGLGGFPAKADAVAKSSAEAGARLTVTWNDVKKQVGDALLPLGAQIQDSLGKTLKELTPTLINLAKGLATAIKLLVDNFGTIANIANFAVQLGAVSLIFKTMPGLIGGASQGLTLLSAAFNRTAISAEGAKAKVDTLKGALKGVAGRVAITFALIGIEKAIAYFMRLKDLKDQVNNVKKSLKGDDYIASIGGQSLDRATLERINQENLKAYKAAASKQLEISAILNDPKKRDFLPGWKKDQLKAELNAAIAVTNQQISRYQAGAQELSRRGKAESGLTNFANPEGKGEGKDAKDQANKQQQLDAAVNDAWLRGQEASHQAAMELIRERYEYELELTNKQRDNWTMKFTGAARGVAGQITQFLNEIDNLNKRRFDAAQKSDQANQAYLSASQRSEFMSQGGRYIQGGIGPQGPNTYGKHFDIKRSDYGYFNRTALDQYVRVNGKPLSTGITVEGGEFGASRRYGKHMGRDYAFGGEAALTLANGAKWVSNSKTRNGDEAAFMTPDGKVYKILHGKFEPPAAVVDTAKGAATMQRKAVAAAGKATVEGIQLDAAKTSQQNVDAQVQQLTGVEAEKFVLGITDAIRQQNNELKDSAEITKIRNKLQMEGVRSEVIDGEVKLQEITQSRARINEVLNESIQRSIKENGENSIVTQSLINSQKQFNEGIAEQIRLTQEATTAQIAFNDAMRFRQDTRVGKGMKEGAQSYVESIGTMREATAQLTTDGIKGLEDQIFSLATTGSANFKQFAADILKATARMIIQQLILRTVLQAIGALGGGGGNQLGSVESNLAKYAPLAYGGVFDQKGIQPFAMGGIVNQPTLFKFANGTGLMGEAGPEAIVPLKRGKDGKLGVAGGGGSTTVNVSVDAKGTSVQGSDTQGAALGRAVAAAVQQELIKQKRPGGLLTN